MGAGLDHRVMRDADEGALGAAWRRSRSSSSLSAAADPFMVRPPSYRDPVLSNSPGPHSTTRGPRSPIHDSGHPAGETEAGVHPAAFASRKVSLYDRVVGL